MAFGDFFQDEVDGQVQRAVLLLGSVEDANDVVQEAFVRVYLRWATLAEPGPYLNRVVLNLCRDHGRRNVVRLRALAQLASREPTRVPVCDPLDDILGQLPFNQRAAVVLRFWGGLSVDEIADQLGCPRGSIGPWIGRALERMRKALA